MLMILNKIQTFLITKSTIFFCEKSQNVYRRIGFDVAPSNIIRNFKEILQIISFNDEIIFLNDLNNAYSTDDELNRFLLSSGLRIREVRYPYILYYKKNPKRLSGVFKLTKDIYQTDKELRGLFWDDFFINLNDLFIELINLKNKAIIWKKEITNNIKLLGVAEDELWVYSLNNQFKSINLNNGNENYTIEDLSTLLDIPNPTSARKK